MTKKIKFAVLSLSILLFLISLTQPAYYIDGQEYDAWANSFGLLMIGWFGALCGGAGLAWFANPLILLAWILYFKKNLLSVWMAALASGFSASFLCFSKVISSEAPTYSTITERKAGYWLWLTSILIFALLATVTLVIENRKWNNYNKSSFR